MKKVMRVVTVVCTMAMCLALVGCSGGNKKAETKDSKKNFSIVTSFYPMHILTMNLVKGIDGVEEKSMSDPNLGCIHDHTFSTEDLKKIEGADVYVENGLDLEVFNDKIKAAYPKTSIIEASKEVTDYVKDGEETNGHVWTSIDDYMKQVQYVSAQLQKLNPENKAKYAANEKAYIDKLNKLKDDYSEQIRSLADKKALILDETLPSFCVFTKIDEMEIETDHEQESISAAQLKDTITTMKKDGVKAIFVAKDTDTKNAEAIAKETGATIYALNSCMVGDVSEDAYLKDMEENFKAVADMK